MTGNTTCSKCKQRPKSRTYCKPCQREYSSEWYKKNRDKTIAKTKRNSERILAWLRDYKTTHGCSKCSYNTHAVALDFHHVDESRKEFPLNAAQRRRYGMERIKKEVDKCIILCANCHRVHHYTKEEDTACPQEEVEG